MFGNAKRDNPAGHNEIWLFPIACTSPLIPSTEVFVKAFDANENEIGTKSLPYRGATEIDEALCGAPQLRILHEIRMFTPVIVAQYQKAGAMTEILRQFEDRDMEHAEELGKFIDSESAIHQLKWSPKEMREGIRTPSL